MEVTLLPAFIQPAIGLGVPTDAASLRRSCETTRSPTGSDQRPRELFYLLFDCMNVLSSWSLLRSTSMRASSEKAWDLAHVPILSRSTSDLMKCFGELIELMKGV